MGTDYFEFLPAEILLKIFSCLSMRDIVCGIIPVNKRFNEICNWDNDLWQLLFNKTFGSVEWFLLITFMKENERFFKIMMCLICIQIQET